MKKNNDGEKEMLFIQVFEPLNFTPNPWILRQPCDFSPPL